MSNDKKSINDEPQIYEGKDLKFTIDTVAENALLLSWKATISRVQHHEIINFQSILKQQLGDVIVETLASYHCLMVYFSLQDTSIDDLIGTIEHIARTHSPNNATHGVLDTTHAVDCIRIPVYYDTEQHWDLAEVAQHCKLSVTEVIKQHSENTYHAFALGFTPGFCYLASLPASIHVPRKSSPRTNIPKGAVAIAEQQSAVYPIESPGGWHIIGQTPLPMFEDKNGEFVTTINLGQNVQFYAISKAEFFALQQGLT